MTIRPGSAWGSVGPRPEGLVSVPDDRAASRLLESCDPAATPPPLTVVRGDTARTAGFEPGRRVDDTVAHLPWDVLDIDVDGRRLCALAHVVVRHSWWRGPIVAVMNVDHLGDWDVAPRAHPNDGFVDVVEVASEMSLRARWQARRRLTTGTHVPHPEIRLRRHTHWEAHFDRPRSCYVDGVFEGQVREISVRLRADGAHLCF